MATFTTSWQSYGAGGTYRLILEIDDPPAVSSGTSSVSLSARLYVQTSGRLSDSSNANAMSGDLGSTSVPKSVSHGDGGGTTLVASVSGSIATVYGSAVTVAVAGSIAGYEALSNLGIGGTVVVPARPVLPPATPSGVTVTRNSDTSHTVTSTIPSSTSAPVTWTYIHRQEGGGAWVTVLSARNAVPSWTDTTTKVNRRYRYRVQTLNGSGPSYASTPSAYVWTTPADPTGASAVKSGSNIVVSWTNRAGYTEYQTQVYESVDGGAYALVATRATGLTSWTHTGPDPARTHQYRLRHITANAPTLASGYSTTATVQLAAPPNAPTNLRGPSIRDGAEDVTWTWTHNPVDTSPQEAFQVRHRPAGGSFTTTPVVTSSVSSWTLPGGTYPSGTTVEWQVRTKSQHELYSAWSAVAVSPTSTRPTVLINAPAGGSVLDTSTLSVEWGYDDAEGSPQAGWTVQLLDSGGDVVEERSGTGTVTTVALATVLPDASSWTVRARVQESAGLFSAWDSAAFTVAYPLPPTPTVEAAWDPDAGTMTVTPVVPEPMGAEVAAVHVDVWRSIDDGPWVLIATGVPLGSAVTDWSPTVAGSNQYRVDAVSALPSVATSAVVEQVTPTAGDRQSVWISGGPGFSQVCRASSNITIGEQAGRATKSLHQFAGRTYPVEVTGSALSRVLSLSIDLLTGRAASATSSPPADWVALAELAGPHLWRDPMGRWVLVSLSPLSTTRGPSGVVTALSLTATQIDAD